MEEGTPLFIVLVSHGGRGVYQTTKRRKTSCAIALAYAPLHLTERGVQRMARPLHLAATRFTPRHRLPHHQGKALL